MGLCCTIRRSSNVAAFYMKHLAQQTFSHHVHEREIAIAFQPHGGPSSGFFMGFHDVPGLFQLDYNGHFADGVLVVVHSGKAHGRVILPWGAADDAVQVFLLAQLNVRRPAVAVKAR